MHRKASPLKRLVSTHLPPDVPAYRLVDKLEDESLNEAKLNEAAVLALAWSRAWNGGAPMARSIASSPPRCQSPLRPGNSLVKVPSWFEANEPGTKDMDVRIGIGLIAVNGVPMVVSGTPEHVQATCRDTPFWRRDEPKKEQLANTIYRTTGLSTDDLLAVLPGACDVIEEYGMLTPPAQEEE